MSFKYSYNTIVYSGEDYLTQVKRLNKFGYDGIELVGEPSWYNFNEVNKLNEEYNIKVKDVIPEEGKPFSKIYKVKEKEFEREKFSLKKKIRLFIGFGRVLFFGSVVIPLFYPFQRLKL